MQRRSSAPAPTEDDYIDAGVDLNGVDVGDLNDYIATLDTTQVDSEEDIQQIADAAGVWLVDIDGDGQKDYADEDDDGDGVSDVEEETTGSDPLDANSTAHHGFVYRVVESPYTHKLWLDRNLGASQVCTAYDDTACYGDYYQWGRDADGHEKSESNGTDVQATNVDEVGHGDFITDDGTYDADWAHAADSNGNLRIAKWSKADGSSVCPVGYRVATIDELNAELFDTGSAEIQNDSGEKAGNSDDRRLNAVNSFLKLPSAGHRDNDSASMNGVGEWGDVWSSFAISSGLGFFSDDTGRLLYDYRAYGFLVRCLRD